MRTSEPPQSLHPVLFRLEAATNDFARTEPKLIDDDVLWVYEKLQHFHDKSAKGRDLPTPSSTIRRKQTLIDRLMDILEDRYEEGLDEHLVNNPNFQMGGISFKNEDAIYAYALKFLVRSVRFWRKERGKKGYLSNIREHLPAGEDEQ